MGDKECEGTQSPVGDQLVIGGAVWGCATVAVLVPTGRAAPAFCTPLRGLHRPGGGGF